MTSSRLQLCVGWLSGLTRVSAQFAQGISTARSDARKRVGSVFRNLYVDIDYGMDNLPDLRSDSVINCRKSLAFLYPLDQTVLESRDQPRVRTRLPSQFCLAPELALPSFQHRLTPFYWVQQITCIHRWNERFSSDRNQLAVSERERSRFPVLLWVRSLDSNQSLPSSSHAWACWSVALPYTFLIG
jgi:hypothetical protein